MNNKGFSMIELLGVIVIIGILAGLAIPAVTKYIGKTRDRAYDNIYESAYSAAQEKYMHDLENAERIDYEIVKDLYNQAFELSTEHKTSVDFEFYALLLQRIDKSIEENSYKSDPRNIVFR